MTNTEKRAIFMNCARFLNFNYPLKANAILQSIASMPEANVAPDFYGTGSLIEDFEKEVAALLHKEAAVFMPSGTMAQLIAMRIWCDKNQIKRFAMHATSHLERHEKHAYRHLHGLNAELLGQAERLLSSDDFHQSQGPLGAALIELPHRELAGSLPEWNELLKMRDYCARHLIPFHLDGARLWESAPYYGKSYSEICSLFDSVYVSFYKGLGGIAGAMLLGPADFISEARIWLRRHGGNLVSLYPYVLAARLGLKQRLPKMKLYHQKALEIFEALSHVKGLTVKNGRPQTNVLQLIFQKEKSVLEASFLQIALQKRIGLFYNVATTENPGESKTELTVGDATLDLDTPFIVELLTEALRR